MNDQLAKALDAAPVASSFFAGFEEHSVEVPDGEVFCRVAGQGSPLLLLHGYPQTSAMWHGVAGELAKSFKVICADLRGYGRSHKPCSDSSHAAYSKRAMANDMSHLMKALGYQHYFVGAHDRGARVAHRLAADYSDEVLGVAMLDIAPTREMYRDGDSAFAQSYWHWYWLTQAAPFPETLIGADPDYFWLSKSGAGSAGTGVFCRQALDEYLSSFRQAAVIHGSCEDYRAAATIDIQHDNADETKLAMPLLVLWGLNGAIEKHFDCLALWRERALDVRGKGLPGGHYLAEELPETIVRDFEVFFGGISPAVKTT